VFEGICPKCGIRHVGWALHFERYQFCTKCGTGLNIYEDGKLIGKGFSPFSAQKLIIDLPSKKVPIDEPKSKE
jgi:hypothetical protein